MQTIYKYPFDISDSVKVKIKSNKNVTSFKDLILSVDVQNNQPCLWCLVDSEGPDWELDLRIVGTGHPCNDVTKDDFIGSIIMNGALVFHVFCKGVIT